MKMIKGMLNMETKILGVSTLEGACSTGDLGSIPGWGRSLGEGNGYPLQYSCLGINLPYFQ